MPLFPIFAISIVVGCLIGSSKGQFASGFLLSLLLGPLGVIIVLCLPNLTKQKEDAERKKLLALQIQLQQAQLQKLDQLHRGGSSLPPPPGYEPKLRIASNGQDLGEMPVGTVKTMLRNGKLTQQDYYFDSDSNNWMQLDCCPDLV